MILRASLLDVGGGIGAIARELMSAGVSNATVVDASATHIAAARDEVQRRGASDRIQLVHGDLVALAPEIPCAAVVTLDIVWIIDLYERNGEPS